ncbi:MAG: NAD(P)-binding protein, partial [Angustibacter sp.]
MPDDRLVAIIGAGVGGLALARALTQRGIPVQVFEQRAELP